MICRQRHAACHALAACYTLLMSLPRRYCCRDVIGADAAFATFFALRRAAADTHAPLAAGAMPRVVMRSVQDA